MVQLKPIRFIVGREISSTVKTARYPYVVLVPNNWDDYGYKTTFAAELFLSKNDSVELGLIKIMNRNQSSGFTKLPGEKFLKLTKDYCSLSVDLEFYEKLYALGPAIYHSYLTKLRDVAYNETIRADFEDLEAYRVSLLRSSGAEHTISSAKALFFTKAKKGRRSKNIEFTLKTRVASTAENFQIKFDFRRQHGLPHRLNAVIGYNGTGKTRLLSNLAIVASGYGYTTKAEAHTQKAGKFIGDPPPFTKVVVVSYSAFDTFVIPGKTSLEKQRLEAEGDLFGYVYCGLREREDIVEIPGSQTTYRLRSPEELQAEFLRALKWIRKNDRKRELLEVTKPLLREASFQRVGLRELRHGADDEVVDLFSELSSGHKIVLKILVDLVAYLDGKSPTLVLIDEPETHLHPPLLATLVECIRVCLESLNGYAIVATHSPVILQETPSRYVRVLKRNADATAVTSPAIETFGESIGVITQEIFNLDESVADWHDILKTLAPKYTIAEIESFFGRSLSFSARSYIMSIKDEGQ